MFVTRENVATLVEQGLLPEGNLCFHIISGEEGVRMPPLSTLNVRWNVARDTPHGVVTQQSENYLPFTFYEWNELKVDRYEGDVVLRFVVRTIDETIPVEVLVMRERAQAT